MPATKKPAKKPTVRRPTMPRVTNNDLQESLIRMEEAMKPLAAAAARVPQLQEGAIRTEGELRDHGAKLTVLFGKTDKHEEAIPKMDSKINTSRSVMSAVVATLVVCSSIVMTVIGYFVSQQSDTLHAISDNTSKTAAAVISMDKRLTVAELQLSMIQNKPASSAASGNK